MKPESLNPEIVQNPDVITVDALKNLLAMLNSGSEEKTFAALQAAKEQGL